MVWLISTGHLHSGTTSHIRSHSTATRYVKDHTPRLAPGLISTQARQTDPWEVCIIRNALQSG